jgi:hypothetical protein
MGCVLLHSWSGDGRTCPVRERLSRHFFDKASDLISRILLNVGLCVLDLSIDITELSKLEFFLQLASEIFALTYLVIFYY